MSGGARPPAVRLAQVGALAWLAGWYALVHLLAPLYAVVARRLPVEYPDFPGLFTAPGVAALCYALPLGALPALLRPTPAMLRLGALLFVGAALVMLLHVDAYNDATFLVGFWMGLWLLWLSGRARRDDPDALEDAAGLLVCIGAFLFLGGVVGKLHAAWWDGDVIRHVLVDERTYWFFPWIRETLAPGEQARLAAWLARIGLVCEVAAAGSVLLPLRAALAVLIAASLGVIACAGWTLFSVLGPPLLTAGYCLWQLGRPDGAGRAARPERPGGAVLRRSA